MTATGAALFNRIGMPELIERWPWKALNKILPSAILRRLPFSWRYKYRRSVFAGDPLLSQQVAELILEKLEARGAVARVSDGSINRIYQLSEAAKTQLREIDF